MDKLDYYRQSLTQIIKKHAQYQPSHGEIFTIPICDPVTDNYLLIDAGWGQTGRVHAIAIHLRIFEEKIWVEVDGTEAGVALNLLELEIPKEDIVLGFIRPKRRSLTEFAIA